MHLVVERPPWGQDWNAVAIEIRVGAKNSVAKIDSGAMSDAEKPHGFTMMMATTNSVMAQ